MAQMVWNWGHWAERWRRWRTGRAPIDGGLWHRVVDQVAFLAALTPTEQARLHRLSEAFLAQKHFHGLMGLGVTDDMAVAIAAQACRPLLHWGPADRPEQALHWYAGCNTVIVSPSEVPVVHEWQDDAGVMHVGEGVASGEISEDGPVLLSWPDVLAGMGRPTSAWLAQREAQGEGLWTPDTPYNVVIHEFCHKIDLHDGEADGCPPLPAGFMGQPNARAARAVWLTQLQAAFDAHWEQVEAADRFGAPAPWLDAYGASDLGEFFPVACEAHFTQPQRMATELPELHALLNALFQPSKG